MARLVVDGDDVVLRLSWRERLLARRREVRVPMAAVKDVRVEPDWWRGLRGVPQRGSRRPGRCLGERAHVYGTDFVAVRANHPVVLVTLCSAAPFARLAVTMPDPDDVVRTLRLRFRLLKENPPRPAESRTVPAAGRSGLR